MAKLEAAGYVQIDKEFVGKKPRTTHGLTSSGREAFARHRRQLEEVAGAGR